MSGSLLQAGNSIAFPKQTIDDTPNRYQEKDTPNRQQEKKNIAQRLQQFEDRRKQEEYKLMEEY